MPPGVATIVFAAGILMLFRLDRPERGHVSPALSIPTAWVLIAGSRMVSEWLQLGPAVQSTEQYLDGSPIDRLVLTLLMAAGLMVLAARWRRAVAVAGANLPLIVFFLYAAASVLWSDYPDVAFKRWTKAFGDLVMILVVLTDADPLEAVKRLLQRAAFLLIPLSILVIKYYPEWGRGYDRWTWSTYYAGVAGGKNGLGYVVLVVGLGSLWQWLTALWADNTPSRTGSLLAHGIVVTMALWLFWKADSATSLSCFLIGGSVLVLASLAGSARRVDIAPVVVGLLIVASLSGLVLGTGSDVVQALGRDTTLTGRTELWNQLLRMTVDPLFGTGFESFWLGERIEKFWRSYWWHPNQAHNGYLEIFLNLGWVGVALLAIVMAGAARNIWRTFRREPGAARLRLALLVVAGLYNMTEAAFKSFHLVWIAFLLAAVARPAPVHRELE